MRHEIKLVQVLSPEVVVLSFDGHEALWARVTVRKSHRCVATSGAIIRGDLAWRPVGNMDYRMHRIGDTIMQLSIERWRAENEDREPQAALPWCAQAE